MLERIQNFSESETLKVVSSKQ